MSAAHDADLGLRFAPNPAADEARVTFELAEAGPVELVLLDLMGRHIRTLRQGWTAAGAHTARVDLRALAPGAYVAVLRTGSGVQQHRLTVLR